MTTLLVPTQKPKKLGEFRLCNLCGEVCASDISPHQHIPNELGLIDAAASGGYDSTPGNGDGALDDGNTYTFSLCEFCLDWLFVQFKIPPRIHCYFGDEVVEGERIVGVEPDRYISAEERVRTADRRTLKDKFFSEFNRRKAARSIKP